MSRYQIQDSVELFERLVRRAKAEQLIAVRSSDNPLVAYVRSSSGHTWYRVTRTSCECASFKHRGEICKHIAYAIHLADTGKLPYRPIVRRLRLSGDIRETLGVAA